MVNMAEEHVHTLVPNYTNGVAAQPNSYGHYLLGHVAGLLRDAERLQQFYVRLDRCPMGSTVLNGSRWPLNRQRMATYLGFAEVADNAFDAVQISGTEMPVELGAVCTSSKQAPRKLFHICWVSSPILTYLITASCAEALDKDAQQEPAAI
jgi:argininosuccinate lyase